MVPIAAPARFVPVGSERGLRFHSWVEGNRKRVDELSDGRLAYIYMPNTATRGQNAFDRDFYSQLHKEGLILDERYNGGRTSCGLRDRDAQAQHDHVVAQP